MPKNIKEEILEEFDKQFIDKTYPFLGGERNYWKTKPKDELGTHEMKQIDDVKNFLAQSIDKIIQDFPGEIDKIDFYGWNEETQRMIKDKITQKIKDYNN